MADAQKQLKIKTGIVKRLVKEHMYYIKEVEKETTKIAKMKEDPTSDEYVIKKAGEVLQESRGMIGDTARRVATAVEDLKKLIAEGNFAEDLAELVEAQAQIEAGQAVAMA